MSPTKQTIFSDRFGRAYQTGARIIYPTRRGSHMELVEATIIGTGFDYKRRMSGENIIFAKRQNNAEVTLRNLWDVVVIP